MITVDTLGEARRALLAHPLRAGLASLGIVAGVATVVASMAVGEGARRTAIADIGALGVDNVFIRDAVATDPSQTSAPELTRDDAAAIAGASAAIADVGLARVVRGEVSAAGGRQAAPIVGLTPSWSVILGLTPAAGRWIGTDDVRASRRVAVAGASLAAHLAPASPFVGADVTVNGDVFKVVGVLPAGPAAAGAAATALFDPDESVLVPIDVMDARLGPDDDMDRVSLIALHARPGADVTAVAAMASRVLASRHQGAPSWEVVVPRELLQARMRAQRTFDVVLLATGALALFISGIGIMNIMLSTVTERTMEIGVRRAFGARRQEIVAQFALEAGVLCGVGGLLGVPSGAALAWAIARFAHWPVAVSPQAAVIAVGLAAAVGLGFGIYPARRAAGVDPVEALRAS
jgi:putative ABC transport system permease protein